MTSVLLVFTGGGIGSVCRFLLTKHLQANVSAGVQFPWGTFFANLLSCLILGLLIEKLDRNPTLETYRWLFIAGFCGGFSTFSSFIWEWISYTKNNLFLEGMLYVGLSFIAGTAFMLLGMNLYKHI